MVALTGADARGALQSPLVSQSQSPLVNQSPTETSGPTSIICPRCGAEVVEVFYGPCGTCRADLRAKLGGRRNADVDVEAAERIHRTPNFVATKD